MSAHTIYKCEECETATDNPFKTKGWVRIDGTVAVAAGFCGESCYKTAYLDRRSHDFCSLACLAAKIKVLMPKPERRGKAA